MSAPVWQLRAMNEFHDDAGQDDLGAREQLARDCLGSLTAQTANARYLLGDRELFAIVQRAGQLYRDTAPERLNIEEAFDVVREYLECMFERSL
jgi:hypothetical protein